MTHADIALWRTDMALTQRAAAEALGITLATYQRLERGQEWDGSKPVTIDRRTALACAAIRAGIHPEGYLNSCDSNCDATRPNDDISASQTGHNKTSSC